MKLKNLSAAFFSGIAMIAIAGAPRGADRSTPTHFAETLPAATSPKITPVRPIANNSIDSLKDLSKLKTNAVTSQWIDSIQSDEIFETRPFEGLATYEPLAQILKKGIVSYDRRTLRSPNYHAEQGYDVVVYDIHHPLSGVSRVMAYSDGEEKRVKMVILTGRPGDAVGDLVLFEGQSLNSQRQIGWSEAQNLFDQELANASTLMSASVK